MKNTLRSLTLLLLIVSVHQNAFAQQDLFNGSDLTGWYAIKTADPAKFQALSAEERAKQIEQAKANTAEFWKVENGALVNEGKGPYLTSEKEFRDFDLTLEFKVSPGADSGLYLNCLLYTSDAADE